MTPEHLKAYVKFLIAGLLSGALGSQCVHLYYRPMKDFDKLVERKIKILEEMDKKQQEENSKTYESHKKDKDQKIFV